MDVNVLLHVVLYNTIATSIEDVDLLFRLAGRVTMTCHGNETCTLVT